jgi:broad specificity phosphatase PhoE
MLVYVRHSDDEVDDATYRHDPKLTDDGQDLARRKGKRIIERYGVPSLIFCSPFRRTKETLAHMLSNLPLAAREKIKIVYDNQQARYFSAKDKKHPDIARGTKAAKVPIYEDYNDFKDRVHTAATNLEPHITNEPVVWVITHTTVYKIVSKRYGVSIPKRIPFMHSFPLNRYCKGCQKYHYKSS